MPSETPTSQEIKNDSADTEQRKLLARSNRVLAAAALACTGVGISYGMTRPDPEPIQERMHLMTAGIASIHLPQKVERPEEGEKPPKWAIEGPKPENMLNSRLHLCMPRPEHFGDYEPTQNIDVPVYYGDKWMGEVQPLRHVRINYPKKNPIEDGKYNLWINFHGAPWTSIWTQHMSDTVLVNLNSKDFMKHLPGDWHWNTKMLGSISKAVAYHYETQEAEPERVGVSGWSKGCSAISRILSFPHPNIDTAVCLDGFHGVYKGSNGNQVTNYDLFKYASDLPVSEGLMDFAREAADGEKGLFIAHSSIPYLARDNHTFYYASTTATTNKLIWWVGGQKQESDVTEPDYPYSPYYQYTQGNFHARGRRGQDQSAHCAVFDDVPEILEEHVKKRGFE